MANRPFSEYAVSGELVDIKKGGVTADDSLLSSKDILDKSGLVHVISSGDIATQSLTTTPKLIEGFTTLQHNIGSSVSVNIPTKRFTALKSGLFRISGVIISEFSNSNEVSIVLYKNGVSTTPPISIQGRGTGKPVQFAYADLLSLNTNDYLELFAYADASITFDIIASSITVEKTLY